MAGAPALACTAYVNLDKGFNMPRPLILSSYITRAEMLQAHTKCSMNGSNEYFCFSICKNRNKMLIPHILNYHQVFYTPKGFYKHCFSFCNKGVFSFLPWCLCLILKSRSFYSIQLFFFPFFSVEFNTCLHPQITTTIKIEKCDDRFH